MNPPTSRRLGITHRAAELACRQAEQGQHLTWTDDGTTWSILLAHASRRPDVTVTEDQIVFPNGFSITRAPFPLRR
jgi:hypothetical protein